MHFVMNLRMVLLQSRYITKGRILAAELRTRKATAAALAVAVLLLLLLLQLQQSQLVLLNFEQMYPSLLHGDHGEVLPH